jgi:hypothetical protein
MVNEQLLLVLAQPVHPPKVLLPVGAAAKVTAVPLAMFAGHVPLLQLTEPLTEPPPLMVTFSAGVVGAALKVAVTLAAEDPMVNWQVVLLPEQAPDQLIVLLPVGAAVKVTCVPLAMFAEQVPAPPVLQLIPEPLTEPPPLTVTLSGDVGTELNVAVTVRRVVMLTVQLPMPLQSPPQPTKVLLALAIGVRTTVVPVL